MGLHYSMKSMNTSVFNIPRFSKRKIFAVSVVTLGIIMSTLASSSGSINDSSASFSEWVYGISMLIASLILSCFLGKYQQYLYSKFKADWREGLFYTHLLSTPGFVFLYKDLWYIFYDNRYQMKEYNHSNLVSVGSILKIIKFDLIISTYSSSIVDFFNDIEIPRLWVYLLFNVFTQCKLNDNL